MIGRAVRTVRGHRPAQLVGRVRTRLRPHVPRAIGLPGEPPPLEPAAVARLGASALADLADPEALDGLRAGTVRAADAELPLDQAWEPADDTSDLAAFTLHYHRWLVPLLTGDGRDRATAFGLLTRWLESFPPSRAGLPLAWHPYVVSCRVRAWTAALGADPPPALAAALAQGLWQSAVLLQRWPETDVAGNHLLRNRSAAACAHALFAGAPAAEGMRHAAREAERLAGAQLGPDGGHLERSVGYHAQAVGDLLDVIEAAGVQALPAMAEAAADALGWLAHVSPPGRGRPELNDSGPGIGWPTATLLRRADGLGVRPARRVTGTTTPRYLVLGDDDTRLLIDCDQPSAPDLPYHAHADSLAIHLAIGGTPVVVDRGVARYEAGPERAWWRSTAAHSTAAPAGGDTSELIGAFRAGRLARTTIVAADPHGVLARHDGAGDQRRKHARQVRQEGPRSWTVWDAPAAPATTRVRWHLPPDADLVLDGVGARVVADGARVTLAFDGAREVRRVLTPHAVGFGLVVPALTIDVLLATDALRTDIRAEA